MTQQDLYAPSFVSHLFDEMARTYGVVNLISSFGFAKRWRRQCLRSIEVKPGSTVLDLMTGMGELCHDLVDSIGPKGALYAVDISPVMCNRARQQVKPHDAHFQVIEANALNCPFNDETIDAVVSTFGLKTFDNDQLRLLAREVARVLRPGGQFAFLEISVPRNWILRLPYMFYLTKIIPLIGRLALGNPDNYRLLGIYTQAFGNCDTIAHLFTSAGLRVSRHSYFFGCATGVSGLKPHPEPAHSHFGLKVRQ